MTSPSVDCSDCLPLKLAEASIELVEACTEAEVVAPGGKQGLAWPLAQDERSGRLGAE